MFSRDHSSLLRYSSALVAVLVATLIRLSLDRWVGDRFPLISFFGAIAFVGWYGGFGPAVLAMAISCTVIPYLLMPPRFTSILVTGENLVGFLAFLFVGFSIALMGGTTRDARRRAELKAEEAKEGQRQLERSLESLATVDREREALLTEQRRLLAIAVDQAATINDLFEQTPVGLALVNQGLCFERINPAASAFFGTSPELLVGISLADQNAAPLHSRALQEMAKHLRETLETGQTYQARGWKSETTANSGGHRFWDWSIHRIERPLGGTVGLLISTVETTDHLRRERAHLEIEARLRVTLGSISDAVIATEADGTIEYMNAPAEHLTGWTLEDAFGAKPAQILRIVDEQTRRDLSNVIDQASKDVPTIGNARNAVLISRNGTESLIDFTASPIRYAGGEASGVVFVLRDVEEHRKDEQALRESERRLLQLADTMPQIVWTAESEGSVDYYNARWYEYTGLSTEQSLAQEGWRMVVHPEDLTELANLRNRAVGSGLMFETEVRLLDQAGDYRWHLIRSVPILDKSGRVLRRFGTATDIHDRRVAEAASRASERRFRQLAELMPQIVWVSDGDLSLEYINNRWFEYTGLSREESADLARRQAVIHPEDVEKIQTALARAVDKNEAFEAEFRLRDHLGDYHWFLGRSVPVLDETGRTVTRVGTSTDIDERKRSENDARFLAETGKMLATLVDVESTLQSVARQAVPFFADWCAVDLVTETGELRRVIMTHADPTKADLAAELVQRSPVRADQRQVVADVLETGVPLIASELNDEFLAKVAWNAEHFEILKKSQLKSYLCVPLKGRNGPIGLLTFVTSESGRKYGAGDVELAEDLAQRATIAVENARLYEELRANDRRKNEFLATLAHELRNPLAPIKNSLYTFDQEEADQQSRAETRAMMKRQVDHISRLVDDLMDMARINQGKVELRKEVLDLKSIIERSLETASPSIEDRGHLLEVSLPSTPILVEADPTRLGQVLDNLLNNASKYTDPGGRIRVSAKCLDDFVELKIRDTGIGMTSETLSHIFELFVQAERRMERSQGGLGIGLSLVRRLVELHGGTVTAKSDGIGLGSEFTVRLPVLDCEEAASTPGSPTPTVKPAALPPRRRILVVDDNDDSARSMALLLKRSWGQEVEVAFDGPTAIQAAESFNPEIILLDIGLPGMSGYEVARRLKARPEFENVLIIAMTGWGQDEDRKRSQGAGFAHHLVKPIDPEKLRELIAQLDPPS